MQTKEKDTVTNEKPSKAPPPQLHAIQIKSKQFPTCRIPFFSAYKSLPSLLAINLTGTLKFQLCS